MGHRQTNGKDKKEFDCRRVPDPALIPEDKTSQRLDMRMKKLFEDARKMEKTKNDEEKS
ncbi:hypothetical protein [Anaerostipes sp.]|uniref:hypothetical protein n=1 Tax=Anaerostipes sp. TaxID=1872530 RepID=UPI0025B9E3E2|nr:hypothetical protein [Anaerostipes sp.]MBS7006954.1 hypothetical protein [Anaerostipes sp.]